jgi:signal transduction histidine kinase
MIYADGDRLMQVLTNLLANAAKFSPAGATVLVRVSTGPQVIRIAVIDHGPGIPENFHAHVFERFAQANSSSTRQSGGSGLGLSIAKAIVERLGGRIGFESAAGIGTTFYVELPIWSRDVERGALAGAWQEDNTRQNLLA